MHSAEGRTRYTDLLLTVRSSLPPPLQFFLPPSYAPVVQKLTLDNPPSLDTKSRRQFRTFGLSSGSCGLWHPEMLVSTDFHHSGEKAGAEGVA